MTINGTIKINNKDYYLNYDINTLCMMKGQGLDVMKLDQIEMDILTIRDLFYFGLCRLQKNLTKEDAGDLMSEYIQNGSSFDELATVITDPLTNSLGLNTNNDEEGK